MWRGLRGLVVAATLVLAVTLTLTGVAGARVRVSLKPHLGRPTTTFSVSFRNPDRTGALGSLLRSNLLTVSGPAHQTGCVSSVMRTLPAARRGHRFRQRLNPRRLGGAWCVGRFRGRVVERQTIVCGPRRACPLVEIRPMTIARFSFRVGPAPAGTGGGGGGQTQGPTFAGVQSVTTCVGGGPPTEGGPPTGAHPQIILPVVQSYTLTWSPATDPVTPSASIVYEIFYSATPGGENFAQPTWTTSPGVGSFSGTLPRGARAYFVVRARDQAGLVDANTVEMAAVSQCAQPYGPLARRITVDGVRASRRHQPAAR